MRGDPARTARAVADGTDRRSPDNLAPGVVAAVKVLLLVILVAACGAVFWLGPMKVVTRLGRRAGVTMPCPFWLGWILLLRPGRWRREQILDRVGITSGERVLELGPGVGVFTCAAARRVGHDGRLVALDCQPRMIDAVRRRVERANVPGVELLVADARTLPLADATFDRVFLISALPEMPDKDRVLAEIRRVLRPGGVLSISEEFFDPEYRFPFETRRLLERAGFASLHRHGTIWMYTLNVRAPE